MHFERLGDMHCATGECPVWHPGEQAVYWTDIPSRCLWRWDAASGQTRTWTLPEMVGCMAPTGDDAWLLAAQTGLFAAPHLAPDAHTATLNRIADVAHAAPGMRFNDGRTDRQGRFWCSTMVMDADARSNAGKLYRYDLDGLSTPVLDDLMIPNGLAFSPNGRTMYLSTTAYRPIAACWPTCILAQAGPMVLPSIAMALTGPAPMAKARCCGSRPMGRWTARWNCRCVSPPCAHSAGPTCRPCLSRQPGLRTATQPRTPWAEQSSP
jgi:sugar lactone lactonase YvrE